MISCVPGCIAAIKEDKAYARLVGTFRLCARHDADGFDKDRELKII